MTEGMIAGITGAIIFAIYITSAKVGWNLMDRWIEEHKKKRADKPPPEKITVVKFTEIE